MLSRRPPGGHRPEDRREDQDRRRPADRHRPRALPADAAERQKIQECFRKAIQQSGGTADGGANGGAATARRASAAQNGGRQPRRPGAGRSGRPRRRPRLLLRLAAPREVPARAVPQLQPHGRDAAADDPAARRPPQTNIKSSSYTIGGVDTAKPGIGVVTPALVSKGRFLATAGGKEALARRRRTRAGRS